MGTEESGGRSKRPQNANFKRSLKSVHKRCVERLLSLRYNLRTSAESDIVAARHSAVNEYVTTRPPLGQSHTVM